MHARKSGARLAALLSLVAVVVALFALNATVALADAPPGPSDPTLTVEQLQSKIDAAGGSMDGYLKTVVKGSDIVTIPVTVLAVTTGYGSGPVDMSSLILFEATGSTIDKIGGIAAGMSGSPIYVDDEGTYKLVGALSYGDIFTTGGTGLATPIEAMVGVQSYYAAPGVPRALATPVYVDGAVKTKVRVVADPATVSSAPADTIVASPMSAVFVGGLNPASRMYKAYAKALEARGISVVPLAAGLSAKTSTYSADFEGGSALAVLAARGDLWVGGIGTVTYTDADAVVAFGHPAFYEGDSGLYLCNAWIDGIWPSTLQPYKLGRPAALRGTLVEDRLAGIMGIDGEVPEEATITAKATNLATGKVATSAVEVPRFAADSSSGNYYGLAAVSAYVAGSRVFDAGTNPGSAATTTTVVVRDRDTAATYTLVRPNFFSDAYDISSAVSSDVDEMVTAFQEVNGNGIAHAQIVSVDLESEFSPARKEAEIVDLTVTGGLKTGDNTVTVSFLQYGSADTQTVDVPLHIPAGAPTWGELSASSAKYGSGGGFFSVNILSLLGVDPSGYGSSTDRRTVSDVVKGLGTGINNSTLSVTFEPAYGVWFPGVGDPFAPEYDAIEATCATGWVVSGAADKTAPRLFIYRNIGSYGDPTEVAGFLAGATGDGVVRISMPGSTPETVAVTPTSSFSYFEYTTGPLYARTTLTATFLGNDSTLPTRGMVSLYVAARTTLSASKKLMKLGSSSTFTVKVVPKTAGGKVAFQRWNGRTWVTLKSFALPSNGTVSYSYKPKNKGTHSVRARFMGTSAYRSSNSREVKIRVVK